MSIGTLWTTNYHAPGKAILAAAAIGGLQIDLPTQYEHFKDNNNPEFRAKFPHGKIPAFESKDGFYLTESYAIARYVSSLAPNSGLLTGDPKTDALIDQWAFFASTEISPHLNYDFALVKGFVTPYNKPIHQDLRNRQSRAYETLNNHLKNNTFVVGERITLADLIIASTIARAFTISFDAELRTKFPHVVRHTETIVNQPKVKDIFGPLELVEKALAYTPPPKEPKPAAPKAEKAAKPAKKPAADDDEEDEKPFEEPKEKNPLDLLPKSTMVFDEWKRQYSNNDTPDALKWLYENYDPEGYSIWRVDYKYPDELTQVFMSSNLIGGFYNRLEASRKHLFGSMGVLGDNNDSLIQGAFITRGKSIEPSILNIAPDAGSYEFRQLDLANAKDKKFFEDALKWELVEDLPEGQATRANGQPPRKWNQGKIYK